jgi:hypothetical protein
MRSIHSDLVSKIEFHGRCQGNPEILEKIKNKFVGGGTVGGNIGTSKLTE